MRLIAVLCLLLAGCASEPPVRTPEWVGRYKNACLPEAVAMAQGLRQSGIHARVVRIGTPRWGHAICAYLYPTGANQLWGWDAYWKSNRLRAWANDPDSIAREWLRITRSQDRLILAQFLD